MGEAFTVNCEVPDVLRADANSRILGLGVTGDPAERFDKARKLAKAASAINRTRGAHSRERVRGGASRL